MVEASVPNAALGFGMGLGPAIGAGASRHALMTARRADKALPAPSSAVSLQVDGEVGTRGLVGCGSVVIYHSGKFGLLPACKNLTSKHGP